MLRSRIWLFTVLVVASAAGCGSSTPPTLPAPLPTPPSEVTKVVTLPSPVNLSSVLFSQDGMMTAAVFPPRPVLPHINKYVVKIGSTSDLKHEWPSEEQPHPVTFSPDGKALACIEIGAFVVRAVDNGTTLHLLNVPMLTNLWATAVSPSGQRVAACSTDGKTHVFDVVTGKLVATVDTGIVSDGGAALALSQDGNKLTVATLVQPTGGTIKNNDGTTTPAAYAWRVRSWGLEPLKEEPAVEIPTSYTTDSVRNASQSGSPILSADGRTIAWYESGLGGVKVAPVGGIGKPLPGSEHTQTLLGLSEDGKYLLTWGWIPIEQSETPDQSKKNAGPADGGPPTIRAVRRWEVSTGTPRGEITGDAKTSGQEGRIVVSPNRKRVLVEYNHHWGIRNPDEPIATYLIYEFRD